MNRANEPQTVGLAGEVSMAVQDGQRNRQLSLSSPGQRRLFEFSCNGKVAADYPRIGGITPLIFLS
jgi:hypothetical protein